MVKDSDIVMQAAKKGAGKGKVDGASHVSAAVRTQFLASALSAGNIMPVLSKVVLEYPLQMHAGLTTLLLSGQNWCHASACTAILLAGFQDGLGIPLWDASDLMSKGSTVDWPLQKAFRFLS